MQTKTLIAALALTGIAAIGLGMAALFLLGGPPPPPERPRPATTARSAEEQARFSETLYRGIIEKDARDLGVGVPAPAAWRDAFRHAEELPAPRALAAGQSLQTRHLRLTLLVRRIEGALEAQAFRADHFVLQIQNLTEAHLAYRVVTRVANPGRCEAKGVLRQNAIALKPRETVARSECLFHRGERVEVTRVEVLELPPLAYHYVSRLRPELVLYEPRTSAGHSPPAGEPCAQTTAWRDIRDGAARNEITWRDLIDFYARHSCDEYAFFPGYRYRSDASGPLPARPPLAEPVTQ